MSVIQKPVARVTVEFEDGNCEVIDFIQRPAWYRTRDNCHIDENQKERFFIEHEIFWTEALERLERGE